MSDLQILLALGAAFLIGLGLGFPWGYEAGSGWAWLESMRRRDKERKIS